MQARAFSTLAAETGVIPQPVSRSCNKRRLVALSSTTRTSTPVKPAQSCGDVRSARSGAFPSRKVKEKSAAAAGLALYPDSPAHHLH